MLFPVGVPPLRPFQKHAREAVFICFVFLNPDTDTGSSYFYFFSMVFVGCLTEFHLFLPAWVLEFFLFFSLTFLFLFQLTTGERADERNQKLIG